MTQQYMFIIIVTTALKNNVVLPPTACRTLLALFGASLPQAELHTCLIQHVLLESEMQARRKIEIL